jgi:hypothetical protein
MRIPALDRPPPGNEKIPEVALAAASYIFLDDVMNIEMRKRPE